MEDTGLPFEKACTPNLIYDSLCAWVIKVTATLCIILLPFLHGGNFIVVFDLKLLLQHLSLSKVETEKFPNPLLYMLFCPDSYFKL